MSDRSRSIRVRVTPDSRREHVSAKEKGYFAVGVKEPARGGRANQRMRELLAAYFTVPVRQVVVNKGGRSRVKLVTVYENKQPDKN